MKTGHKPRDTVVRWIALTIALAMVTSLALNILFIQLAGVWAQPSLTKTGLLEQAAAITRVLEAAPHGLREKLAAASTTPAISVAWYATRAAIELPPFGDDGGQSISDVIRDLLGDAHRPVETFEPADWPRTSSKKIYILLVGLNDGSWLTFVPPYRSWGLNGSTRIAIILALVLVSTLAVAWIATKRLARPLQRFARAARRFGEDFHAPSITPMGPHEIRQAILAFNSMQAQIQSFIADRTQMLSAISHDLRAPLTRMRLRGEFIEDREQQKKLFRDVDEMQAMVNSALDFFRDDARLEQSTHFDLAELLMTLQDDYRDQGVEIAFRGPSRLVYYGRPLGLKRVVTNLLENAVKYARKPWMELESTPSGVAIKVCDAGPGIPEDYLDKVFAPFYRLETSRNRNTGGVGLGLSAARAIVKEHGGDLNLSNLAGGGLLACVVLPPA